MTTTTSPRTATRSVWRAGLVTAAVAAVLTTLVWLVGQLSPATWQVTQGDQTREVLAFMPALASIMGVAVGTVSLWVLSGSRGGGPSGRCSPCSSGPGPSCRR
jgi:hypothetical protein